MVDVHSPISPGPIIFNEDATAKRGGRTVRQHSPLSSYQLSIYVNSNLTVVLGTSSASMSYIA